MKIIAVIMIIMISACNATATDNHKVTTDANKSSETISKEPDKTGSWSQINQPVVRPANWKKYVTDSDFQLGAKSVRGTWQENDKEVEYYEIKYGTYPNIDGSTVALPMVIEFARQHLGLSDEDAANFTYFSTTHYAYVNLISKTSGVGGSIRSENLFLEENHPIDLIIATEPSDEELNMAEDSNVELVVTPVCYDAFVFITHKDNPVESVTVEQIQKIYTGEITNWKEVGGDDKKIVAFQREENSGSQTAMESLVMKGKKMMPPETVEVIAGMGALIETVAEYQNNQSSIGYTYKYYIDTLYKNDNIKILKVEGVSPENENLRGFSYPFTTTYNAVIRKEDKDKTGGRFVEWMLSEEGQNCIEQAGYIPLNANSNIIAIP